MAETTLGTIQIQALPVASKPDGTELLHIKQGTADKRTTIAEAIAVHGDLKNNPHGVTNVQVGLGNVTNDAQLKLTFNLSDVPDKAVARTNLMVYSKSETDSKFTPQTRSINGYQLTSDITLDSGDVGLSNVPNYTISNDYREDADKFSTARAVSALFRAIQAQDPVGTVLHTFDNRNPATYKLCGGTWQLIGKGRTLVGWDDGNSSRPVGTEFGSATATLTVANLPRHSIPIDITSGTHSHGVVGSTRAAGGHGHNVSGSTSSFDYGTKSGTTGGDGGHNHSGNTNSAGNHRHRIPTDDVNTGKNMQSLTSTNNDDEDYRDWTDYAGEHTHSFTTNSVGDHNHAFSLSIGSHGHTVSGTAAAVGDHDHDINFTSQSSSVRITGNTGTVGGDSPFSIESKSLVCYIWRRMS